ncbi:hypothetical protein BC829DRAFT_249645 [Chytridium lagenaria]|nr:hypothetical protein BC829DRAFT_249645 [Chytridium lagenaria]
MSTSRLPSPEIDSEDVSDLPAKTSRDSLIEEVKFSSVRRHPALEFTTRQSVLSDDVELVASQASPKRFSGSFKPILGRSNTISGPAPRLPPIKKHDIPHRSKPSSASFIDSEKIDCKISLTPTLRADFRKSSKSLSDLSTFDAMKAYDVEECEKDLDLVAPLAMRFQTVEAVTTRGRKSRGSVLNNMSSDVLEDVAEKEGSLYKQSKLQNAVRRGTQAIGTTVQKILAVTGNSQITQVMEEQRLWLQGYEINPVLILFKDKEMEKSFLESYRKLTIPANRLISIIAAIGFILMASFKILSYGLAYGISL